MLACHLSLRHPPRLTPRNPSCWSRYSRLPCSSKPRSDAEFVAGQSRFWRSAIRSLRRSSCFLCVDFRRCRPSELPSVRSTIACIAVAHFVASYGAARGTTRSLTLLHGNPVNRHRQVNVAHESFDERERVPLTRRQLARQRAATGGGGRAVRRRHRISVVPCHSLRVVRLVLARRVVASCRQFVHTPMSTTSGVMTREHQARHFDRAARRPSRCESRGSSRPRARRGRRP